MVVKTLKKAKKFVTDFYIEHLLGNDVHNPDLRRYEVAVYMSGGLGNHYQLMQWTAPLKALAVKHPTLVITRNAKLFMKLKKEGAFPVVFLRTFNDLSAFYYRYSFPVVLYVNNARQNFQSLAYTEGFHIHLNHGESEKESMRSNQSKAYDAVFCAGERAVERYREALLNFDSKKYIKIGRPQLDFIKPFFIEKESEQKVILYAPTWEGHLESMDYCSVAEYGETLVQALLDNPQYIVLYKPHGNIGTRRKDILKAHRRIQKIVEKHPNGRMIYPSKDINSLFTVVDFAFFDNSSIMIDYLHVDKPAFFFYIREDEGLRYLSKCFEPISNENIAAILKKMERHLCEDPARDERAKIKNFYLGNYAPMESTEIFIKIIANFISSRKQIKGER